MARTLTSTLQFVMEDLGNDLPAAVHVNQRQQVGEVLGQDGAFDLGQGRHRPGKPVALK